MSPGGGTTQITGTSSNRSSSSSITSLSDGAPTNPLKNGNGTLDVHDGTPCRSSNRASGKAARIGSQLRKLATSASTRRSSDTRRSYA